ncbi:MAG: hypothetical protein U0168_30390, partial [Nannocystaceae bacterium]
MQGLGRALGALGCACASACAFDATGATPGGSSSGAAADSSTSVSAAAESSSAGTGGSGDGGGDALPPGPWDQGWPIPAEPQLEGDAEAGWQRLVTEGYVSCGIPMSMW